MRTKKQLELENIELRNRLESREVEEKILKSEKESLSDEREIYKRHKEKGTLNKYYKQIEQENEEKRKQAIQEIKNLTKEKPPEKEKDINKLARLVSVYCDLPFVYVKKLIQRRKRK